ncbi:MAG: hypothetical protein CMF60_01890 [Magnetococcales bacterium]|nr:hypothetical protein [Magnetococcales bacterium]
MYTLDDLESYFSEENLLKEFTGQELCEFLMKGYEIRNSVFESAYKRHEYFQSGDFSKSAQWFEELEAVYSIALEKPDAIFQINQNDKNGPDIYIDGKGYQIVSTVDGTDARLRMLKLSLHGHVSCTGPIKHFKRVSLELESSWEHAHIANSNYVLDDMAFQRFKAAYAKKADKKYPGDMGLILYCNDRAMDVIKLSMGDSEISPLIREHLKGLSDFSEVFVTVFPLSDNKPIIIYPCTPL